MATTTTCVSPFLCCGRYHQMIANTYITLMLVFKNAKYNLLYCFSMKSANFRITVYHLAVQKKNAPCRTQWRGVAYWAFLFSGESDYSINTGRVITFYISSYIYIYTSNYIYLSFNLFISISWSLYVVPKLQKDWEKTEKQSP